MFLCFYCRMFFVLKNMQYKIRCSSHSQIALSFFFSVYHSVLADKFVDINYSEKSMEWVETNTDSDSDCELFDLFLVVVDSQLNAYVFITCF